MFYLSGGNIIQPHPIPLRRREIELLLLTLSLRQAAVSEQGARRSHQNESRQRRHLSSYSSWSLDY